MAQVKLLVYDLSDEYSLAKEIFNFLPGPEVKGIWHSSITVHGKEIDYGQRGVYIVPEKRLRKNQEKPGKKSQNDVNDEPCEIIPLGITKFTQSTIIQFAKMLGRNQFKAENYNVVNNNCHCFSNMLVKNILKQEIPKFLRSLPNNVITAVIGKLFVTGSHLTPASKDASKLYGVSKPVIKEIVEEENVKA